MKKGLTELVGHVIEHNIFGECEVIEINDLAEGKFTGRVLKDNSTKKLIFSKNYFKNIDDYESVDVPVFVRTEKRKFKEPDLSKHRNHPLVKSIDWKSSRERVKVLDHDVLEDEQDDEELED